MTKCRCGKPKKPGAKRCRECGEKRSHKEAVLRNRGKGFRPTKGIGYSALIGSYNDGTIKSTDRPIGGDEYGIYPAGGKKGVQAE